jgi:molecular chaperone DnaK (HSP70)
MLQPEHLLIALMSKAKRIVENHNMSIEQVFIAIPSYLSHYERKIIKKCAEIAKICKEPMLVDDWICLATDYSYSKIKQLKTSEPRSVVFVDVGYSKLSLFTVSFNQNEAKLLDC